jgi:lipopolysaccharide transport system permease protein
VGFDPVDYAAREIAMIEVRRIFRYRSLLQVLTSREVKGRYRGSVLGVLWTFVNPLLLMLVYTFVFTQVFKPRFGGDSPYPLFLICGLFPWIWMSTSVLEGTSAILRNAGLIQRSVFPAELLPMVPVLTNLTNFVLSLPVILAGVLVARWLEYPVGNWGIIALPLVIALTLLFLAGLALFLSALATHFKDIRDIVANLMTLLFFTTPVIYGINSIETDTLRLVVQMNPFTPFVVAFQDTLFFGQLPGIGAWVHMLSVALVSWLMGAWIFDRLRDTLAEAV